MERDPYWDPIPLGDHDPYYVNNPGTNEINWCNEMSPVDDWFCSRAPGHPGLHVASNEEEVLEVWGETPPDQRLPEGF
jgi:hypothetical protein